MPAEVNRINDIRLEFNWGKTGNEKLLKWSAFAAGAAACVYISSGLMLLERILSLVLGLPVWFMAVFCFNAADGAVLGKTALSDKIWSFISAAAVLLSCGANGRFFLYLPWSPSGFKEPLATALLAVPALIGIWIFFLMIIPRLKSMLCGIYAKMTKCDRAAFIVIFLILSVSAIYVFSCTSLFGALDLSGASMSETDYDVLYTLDINMIIKENAHLNPLAAENDGRQILFAAASAPFFSIAFFVSKLFFFVPNIYPMCLGIVQCFIISAFPFILIQLMGIEKSSGKLAFAAFYCASFPFMLFSLAVEQYVAAVFWLLLFLHAHFYSKENQEFAMAFSGGSLLTSFFFLPWLMSRDKDKQSNILSWVRTAAWFLLFTGVFMQMSRFFDMFSSLKDFVKFTGVKLTLAEKLYQYTGFFKGLFIMPESYEGYAIGLDGAVSRPFGWQLSVPEGISIFGIIVLALAVIGFILNRKDRFSQMCIAWVGFSFALLFLFGWGTAENGLILYSLYFSWAFIALIFKGLEKAFGRFVWIPSVTAAVLCLTVNIHSMRQILSFGIENYPV